MKLQLPSKSKYFLLFFSYLFSRCTLEALLTQTGIHVYDAVGHNPCVGNENFTIILITFARQMHCIELIVKFTLCSDLNSALYRCSKQDLRKVVLRFSY